MVDSDRDSPAEFSEPVDSAGDSSGPPNPAAGKEVRLRLRVSLWSSSDVRLLVNTEDTVRGAKAKLYSQERQGVGEPARQRWYFGGKLLGDKLRVGDLQVPQGYVIQCVVSPAQDPGRGAKE